MVITRNSPITVLNGVGKTRAEYYAKIGIFTLGDLLLHYPRAYENRGDVVLLADARENGKSSMILTVASDAKVVRMRSHKSFLKFRAFDESGSCEITYFNQDYLKSQFRVGTIFRFFGKVERVGKRYTMSSPVAEPWAPSANLPSLCAVYRMTEGLSPKQIAKDVAAAIDLLAMSIEDPLPQDVVQKRGLCTLSYALCNIHKPETPESLMIARRRLVYDEFFCFSLGAAMSQRREKSMNAPACPDGDVSPLLKTLPYELTGAQKRTIDEIARDMAKNTPMGRIVVGDVGCGKTVCAAAAMLIAVKNGRQAALMAPTEILARQHYLDLAPVFEEMGISTALLVGATTAAEKRRIKAALSSEDEGARLQVVIGTHALLSDGVEFAAPGLVVTDEQHRFGARQRAKLAEKNTNAHLLVMSATPIPRSLALVLYGELDISRIDEMPAGRQRVDTFVVDETYRARLNAFIQKQVDEGGQVYVVCPAVEEQEKEPEEVTLSNVEKVKGSRLFSIVTYIDEPRLKKILASRAPFIRSFAYIYHDKDNSKPHRHLILDTYDIWTKQQIKEWFSHIKDENTFVQQSTDIHALVEYITHTDDGSFQKGKLPYSTSEIVDGGLFNLIQCEAFPKRAGTTPLKAVVAFTEEVRKSLPRARIALLHGRMKSKEKDAVMQQFAEGKVDVLVSTTVIEVGVNVPNAALMIVENAERFGLSQLHQLRGRVGRGVRKSHCILVMGGDGAVSRTSRERLEVMRTTYDGYRIAEQDLAQRGPGDFLATAEGGAVRQSGGLSFRLADAGEDISVLTEAAADAREILATDPELSQNALLREHIKGLFSIEAGLIS